MQTLEVKNISDMLSVLEKLQSQFGCNAKGSGFLFRGAQDAAYSLLPGIYRCFGERQKARLTGGSIDGKVYPAYENEILAHFRKEAGGILNFVAQSDDFTWLQYAQHYGVPTRLLDFSANPLVALYFCCHGEKPCDGAVWVLNSHTYQRWMCKDFYYALNEPDATTETVQDSILRSMKGYADNDAERVEVQKPLLFIPAYIDQRMAAQSSRFLLWGADKKPLEAQISTREEMNISKDGVAHIIADDTRFLCKIIIPDLCKSELFLFLQIQKEPPAVRLVFKSYCRWLLIHA